jgi:hypothetical protein
MAGAATGQVSSPATPINNYTLNHSGSWKRIFLSFRDEPGTLKSPFTGDEIPMAFNSCGQLKKTGHGILQVK